MNSNITLVSVQAVADRFHSLAQQENWFGIQDELFAGDVQSIEPVNSPWLKMRVGKSAVRKKGEDWVARITAVHRTHTSAPVIADTYFAVGREMDITVNGIGRLDIKELMVYQVKDGRIISEQFFY